MHLLGSGRRQRFESVLAQRQMKADTALVFAYQRPRPLGFFEQRQVGSGLSAAEQSCPRLAQQAPSQPGEA